LRNRLKPAAGNHFGLSEVGWSTIAGSAIPKSL
jgi:hypothetical protein